LVGLIAVFLAFPIAASFVISFFRMNLDQPGQGTPFVGIQNYIRVVTDREFVPTLGRTAYFALVSTALTIVMGLGFALALKRPFRGSGLVRSLVILPWAVPAVIAGLLWKTIYDTQYGALNGILSSLGLINTYQAWLNDGFTALNLVMVTQLWIKVPFAVILFSAALAAIPEEVLEAARVDGATSIGSFRFVMFPLLRPMVALVLVLSTAWELFAFDTIYAITGGGPANETNVLAYYAYQKTFSFLEFGLGSALGYVITAIVIGLAVLYIRALGRETQL
jgi:ABC-type sugar transport system permease subunit